MGNSMSIWCEGRVQNIQDNLVTVSFYYPDMDPYNEAPCTKELPLGHCDLRPHIEQPAWAVGRAAEVFSRSRNSWLLGEITDVFGDNQDWVTVSFRYPDVSDTELYKKELQIGSSDLRLVNTNG